MTLIKPFEEGADQDESLAVAEQLFEEAGVILGRLLSKARQDDDEAIGRARTALKELAEGWKMAVTERNRVADERKKTAGIEGSYAVDYAAARSEIGRRLARLRAAGSG
ncbi:Gene Transfer Agent (GTA) [Candidatus Rhodobacter oscarellae]|uniref:Gene Transfer Agent (GTA) n=1 Tax=Candidatus Rhodobacter oscarellae TaxID=1675527 RepID=A0A0J9E401_9RHOB|nr:hypothetical protein [Candidatus Rhodobacter lobularis]KMW56574.1 Gene Transfer Agent (GTA) [Candidatus Rhodobacter lobularis]